MRIFVPLCLASLVALSGCANAPTATGLRVLRVRTDQRDTYHRVLRQIEFVVASPEGTRHVVTAEAQMGATNAALCEDLARSLRARGCEATHRTAETSGDRRQQDMDGVLELPAGWSFAPSRVLHPPPASNPLEVALEAAP